MGFRWTGPHRTLVDWCCSRFGSIKTGQCMRWMVLVCAMDGRCYVGLRRVKRREWEEPTEERLGSEPNWSDLAGSRCCLLSLSSLRTFLRAYHDGKPYPTPRISMAHQRRGNADSLRPCRGAAGSLPNPAEENRRRISSMLFDAIFV
jgi:hypothetical protein